MEQLSTSTIPTHIAIIMDGNGRWATAQGLPRTQGHAAGANTVHTIIETAARAGVQYLTLYTFSTENWDRPQEEVSALMDLLMEHLNEEEFMKNNLRFRIVGEMNKLSATTANALNHCIERTATNTGLCVTLAFSYSSRWELTEMTKSIANLIHSGDLTPEQIDEQLINKHLKTAYMPDPDLLIRTGGEQRLSNYLLWQCAYAELYFTPLLWPDFKEEAFHEAIREYQRRERRFGKTGEQIKTENK